VRRCISGGAGESVRCNARSGEQHEHRRKTRWARKEGEALRSLQSAHVRVPEGGLTERGEMYSFNHLCELSLRRPHLTRLRIPASVCPLPSLQQRGAVRLRLQRPIHIWIVCTSFPSRIPGAPGPGLSPPPQTRKPSNGEHECPQGEAGKEMQRKDAWDAGGV
jgi:hypothetical protein